MEKFNLTEACERVEQIRERMLEIADNLEADKEREDYTPAEAMELKQLKRDLNILEKRIDAGTKKLTIERQEEAEGVNKQIREYVDKGQRFEVKIKRAVAANWGGNASGYANPATSTNPAPLTTHDIVEPLWKKNILSAIGSPLLTGLKGNHQWPVVEAFSATIQDEAVALGDTRIPLSKLIAKPERIGIAVPITREALIETDNLLQLIATQYIPEAAAQLMNQIMFSSTAVTGATNLVGPFVNVANTHKKEYTGDVPTLADLLAVKGVVLAENINAEGMCYVMREDTKALLEGTPKWSGANQAIVENDRINGVPVFTTNFVAANTILFGAFKYAPQGLFGDMTFIVDPYTLARKNAIDFVLNVDYAITVLRQEAFAILSKHTS